MRFQDVGDEVLTLVDEVKKNVFDSLRSAKIKVLFDTKKRLSGGNLVLGRMQKTSDLLRHLTSDEAMTDEGYDYIMYICKVTYDNVDFEDKVRLIRRQLSKCEVDMDSNTSPYKLRGFETEDFYDEIEYNKEEPRWYDRCTEITESIYETD